MPFVTEGAGVEKAEVNMHDHAADTIYAVSTGIGRAAIAVVRLSGPQCSAVLKKLSPHSQVQPRQATLMVLRERDGDVFDRAIVLSFPAPRSFTGENMLEFHLTGSRAVVSLFLSILSEMPGLRPAEPGEFARRAFENGKLDLIEVEGLAAVIDAETSAQLRHAQKMVTGKLSRAFEEIRGAIVHALAMTEAMLDFSDIEDAEFLSRAEIVSACGQARAQISNILQGTRVAERLRDGMSIVIAGPPNVGKSTLLNYLAKRDVAIVSALPGTTRDALEVFMELDGYPIIFTDTAGIRGAADVVEAEGIRRSYERIAQADLVLWLFDDIEGDLAPDGAPSAVLRVKTKADLPSRALSESGGNVEVSARTGHGIDALLGRIANFASLHFAGAESVLIGSERQKRILGAVDDALLQALSPEAAAEIVAEDLRRAAFEMGRLTGKIDIEELLDEIFSRLCVGK